jgi:hypothetical protein
MAEIVAISINGVDPEEYGPDKGSVIFGNPRFGLWNLDEGRGACAPGSGRPHRVSGALKTPIGNTAASSQGYPSLPRMGHSLYGQNWG